jgi:hypothetical protein
MGYAWSRDARDVLVVDEVSGDRNSLTTGGTFRVRGHYHLESEHSALIAVYVTSFDPRACPHEGQAIVPSGDGTFDLTLSFCVAGYPHVSFYASDGSAITTVYFGTGGSVYRCAGDPAHC